ncbi:MAG: CGGC domain-containing protein [Desulfobacteraceae bacterium]|nr:CGGC domain-containing protein [Desulfobacteraceae bacterium]MBL7216527.1 CGGC domain-containing protein [Desulfobacteraceae bacterium]
MARVGILGCDITTKEMNCVMVGCFGNLRGREGSFKDYPADEPLDLVGVIHCGGCPTAVGSDRIWQKVQALVDYGIDSLHLNSCLIQLCPFKDVFLETIKRDYPDLKVVEGTHPFHDPDEFKKGIKELVSQRVVTPQTMNDLVFKKIKLPPEKED